MSPEQGALPLACVRLSPLSARAGSPVLEKLAG